MAIAGILKHKGFDVTTVTAGMTIAEVAQVLGASASARCWSSTAPTSSSAS